MQIFGSFKNMFDICKQIVLIIANLQINHIKF